MAERPTSGMFAECPPASPWGVNFGGGSNSTAMLIELRRRGFSPDWILFADTGSEWPWTYEHLSTMVRWCDGWTPLTVVRWIRKDGTFESLHANCLRTSFLPSKWYGFSGCTSKWKIQPMERWRKEHNFQRGCFAVGYDAGETRRIGRACARGDDPSMLAWYPLVAWGMDRECCDEICRAEGITPNKSACFICPNTKSAEWRTMRDRFPDQYQTAMRIRQQSIEAGNHPQAGRTAALDAMQINGPMEGQETADFTDTSDDRCVHGACWT